MKKVIVYTTTWCPYCQSAKEYLTQKGVSYEERNAETDMHAREELVQKSGQTGVPVLDIGGKIVVGFSAQEIDQALEE